ncbi:MAG TPA: hypothetical protein VN886_07685 [Acidimicrobiales bacterium]|nr:hypothetical protein [Acidimicrobiales bacterium]
MDHVTGPVHVDAPVPGDGMVSAPHDPVSGNGRGSDHPQTGLGPALRRAPLRALLIGVLLAIVAGVGGWHANSSATAPLFTSRTVMAIDEPYGMATAGDEGLLLKLVTLRVKYQGLASTDAMAGPVATKLGLPVNGVLAGTSVALPADSLLLVVTGTSTTAGEAQRLSSAMAAEITSYVKTENTEYVIPATDQFMIDTVDPTTPAMASTPAHKSAADAIGLALVALILGFVVSQLIFNRRLLTA